MEHHFLDRYSELESPVHRLDPRIKIVSALGFILIVVSSGPVQLTQAAAWLALILFPTLLSRIPPLFVLKRSLVIIPFVLIVGLFIPFLKEGEAIGSYNLGLFHLQLTRSGLEIYQNLLIKSYLSILALILLTSTSKFSDLNLALEKLRFPRILLLSTSFMYRYLFVLADEMMKMDQGRKSRQTRKSTWKDLRILGQMIGILFIRSYERGERVYSAMLSRAFVGKFSGRRQLHLPASDALLAFVFISVSISIGFLGG